MHILNRNNLINAPENRLQIRLNKPTHNAIYFAFKFNELWIHFTRKNDEPTQIFPFSTNSFMWNMKLPNTNDSCNMHGIHHFIQSNNEKIFFRGKWENVFSVLLLLAMNGGLMYFFSVIYFFVLLY